MTRVLDSSVGVQATNAAFGWQAHGSAFHGRVTTSHQQFRRGIQMSQQSSFHEVTAQLTLEDAEIHAIVGQCDHARREAQAGLEISRGYVVLTHASRIFALCGPIGIATSLSNELVRRYPTATLAIRVHKPIADAAVAVLRREPARALELLDAVKPYDLAPFAELWPAYLRGLAYLQLKDGRAAAGQFRSVLNNRGVAPQSPLYPLAYLELARAAALQGEHDDARKAYEAMLSIWKDADPDLQPFRDARAEFARRR
jgi:tetratricopeptide (TPR) repeat protein